MKSKRALEIELDELGISPDDLVQVDAYNPEHLDILADLDTKRSIEHPQPGDCLNPWGNTWLLHTPEGTPIGFLALRLTEDGYLGIDAVYVLPEYRGRKYGYVLTLVSQLVARAERLPLVALQPLTSDGRALMERAGITIKSIDPLKAVSLQSFAEEHWQELVNQVSCKHTHARSSRSACDKCIYRYARPVKRRVLEFISGHIRLGTSLGAAA